MNSSFLNNKAKGDGNVMNLHNNIIIVEFCKFSANIADLDDIFWGGVIYGSFNEFILKNCDFSGNIKQEAGGIYLDRHLKYNNMTVLIDNLIGNNNTVLLDAGFLSMSMGIYYYNITLKNSYFTNHFSTACILILFILIN